jgi:hypothetical protein
MARINLVFTDLATAKARWATCTPCEYFDHRYKSCYQCGCFMPTKVRKPAATCPENKWDHITIVELGEGIEFHYPLSDIDPALEDMGDI